MIEKDLVPDAKFQVMNTGTGDLNVIFGLFDQSITYQEKNGYPSWRNYDRNAVVRDIENGNQYKIVVDGEIAIVFSVCYGDEIIWRERDRGNSIYLHRIVVNPNFKGRKLFGRILDWAIEHCKKRKILTIRMDTWAANPKIADYYKSFGFRFVENFTTPDTPELPVHNRKLALTLLEFQV
jgi:GNAT superfamily N-acetyltransferase